MKEIIPKWKIEKVEVVRNGIIDNIYSGYELQKDGIVICKFGLDSLTELKQFFKDLILPID